VTDPSSSDSSQGELAGTVSWRALAHDAQAQLAAAGIEAPATEARWLAEEASGIEPGSWFAERDELARQRAVSSFDAMLGRRLTGEPIQYVLGRWSFRSLDLAIDQRVLIPRPETESLVDLALREMERVAAKCPVVVDLGTGSGAIALSIASEHRTATVVATDASPDALTVARSNVAGIGMAGARVTLHEGSWFEALPPDMANTIDLVVSNPPYISADETLPASVREWEPEMALVAGPRGIEAVELILVQARSWLAPHGSVVLEMASDQTATACELAQIAGYGRSIVAPDLTGRARFVVAGLEP
jgi:release factor glutamine methyltransferase